MRAVQCPHSSGRRPRRQQDQFRGIAPIQWESLNGALFDGLAKRACTGADEIGLTLLSDRLADAAKLEFRENRGTDFGLYVARLAKVITATVSRVANGNPQVEAEIQARVLAASRQLGVDLTSGSKTRNIAFVLGNRDMLNAFQSQVLMGAEGHCAQHGWDLQFISFVADLGVRARNLHLPEALIRHDRVGGVILSGTHSASTLTALREKRVPFSVLGNNIVGSWGPEEHDCVTTDDVRGAAEVTRHLVSQGHRKIHFIGGQRLPWYAHCAEGYIDAMKDAGLEPRLSETRSADRELGYLAAKTLLVNGERPTAIFAGNDQAAAGVYGALQESGARIPR